MVVQEQIPLAPFTTLGVGGPAQFFVEAFNEDDLLEALAWASQQSIPVFLLGGGSNLVIADTGFPGLVLRIALRGVEFHEDSEFTRIYRAAAGEPWDDFVQRTIDDRCSGIECLAGIPGTVGGTPVQNVGAYGQEVSETIHQVRVLDLEKLHFHHFSNAECAFSYRSSRFNSTDAGRYLVTRVDYNLRRNGAPTLRYADLQKVFEPPQETGATPSLAEVAATVRRIRRSKGMLLVADDPDCRSAGSFFKNPIVSASQLETIASRFGQRPPAWPVFASVSAAPAEELFKLPAAWLIEHAGFLKGFQLGRAGISTRHTLAIVNLGGATAADILTLRDLIIERLLGYGVVLQMEPVMVGF
jgi:UDP-N-acetylmuramate dehydrogenase